jgi:hypothetical protein
MDKTAQIVIGGIFGFFMIFSIISPIAIYLINPIGWTDYTEPGVFRALENFEIYDKSNQFKAILNRDFMPTYPPNSNNLAIIVYYSCPEVIERIWILDGENISSSRAGTIHYASSSEHISENYMYWDNGPKWDTKIYVDVVLKISLPYHTFYLVAKHIYISETW